MTRSDVLNRGGENGSPPETAHAPLPAGAAPCVIRHLAYAAGDLAGEPGLKPAVRDRYRAAEAKFRSLADAEWNDDGRIVLDSVTPPSVQTGLGTVIPVAELLIRAWERHGRPFPSRTIDPDMVEAARQLLQELLWQVPA